LKTSPQVKSPFIIFNTSANENRLITC